MSRELAVMLESLELVHHAHTDFELSVSAGSNSGFLTLGPTAPYEAAIIYWFTYGDVLSGVWQIKSQHSGYPRGTKMVGPDELEHGVTAWIYVTNQFPLLFYAGNTGSTDAVLYATLWHENVMSLRTLDIIKVIEWEWRCPGMLKLAYKYGFIPELPNLPVGFLADIFARYPEIKADKGVEHR